MKKKGNPINILADLEAEALLGAEMLSRFAQKCSKARKQLEEGVAPSPAPERVHLDQARSAAHHHFHNRMRATIRTKL